MAKWTVTFEDTRMEGEDSDSVSMRLEMVDGPPIVENEDGLVGYTGATQCAMTILHDWDKEIFQKHVMDSIEPVVEHAITLYTQVK